MVELFPEHWNISAHQFNTIEPVDLRQVSRYTKTPLNDVWHSIRCKIFRIRLFEEPPLMPNLAMMVMVFDGKHAEAKCGYVEPARVIELWGTTPVFTE
ncbi:MAG: hypothetical protein HQL63_03650 [Magnetococcales bacterium]|nr:hypothetical protein [Magnetococcales bacterium]MBF0323138.1 hypothetical protein [Magnetococcales bacterium]